MTSDARLTAIAAGKRRSHLGLLWLADEAHEHVRAHLDDGEVFTWTAAPHGGVVGATQAVPRTRALWELTLVAVTQSEQGRGHGLAMLGAVVDHLAARGARRVIVGTASAGVGQLVFYQRAGFRVFAVERDHFDRARGYDGTETEHRIVIRDLVWLDRLIP